MNDSICIFGAGGHAAVIIQALRAMGQSVRGCYDDNSAVSEVLGVPVLGSVKGLPQDFSGFCVMGIGSNAIRQQLHNRFASVRWATVIHPSAIVDSTATIGYGTVILAGAIVQARAFIGNHVIVNTRSVVDHDSLVEAFAHVAQGAVLGGGVRVGSGVLVGLGASIESGAVINQGQNVQPGEVVLRPPVPLH